MPSRRPSFQLWLVPTAALVAVLGAAAAPADDTEVRAFTASAKRAGLRVVEGTRLVLATDRPPREGDGVPDLPRLFSEAFDLWCRHYGLDPTADRSWRARGCLIVDRERFRTAGLLPPEIPEFVNGFCDRDRFWLLDQSNLAYRRHLLFHEGVHAFTHTLRHLDSHPWYTEGIAEYLATHRLEPDRQGVDHVISTPLPARKTDVEQLGRIEQLRSLEQAGRSPTLAAVLGRQPSAHRDIAAYAADWALVTMLAQHPAYAKPFTAEERRALDATLNGRLATMPGWQPARAARDYASFLAEVDYGFDFNRSAIDWSAGRKLESATTIAVDAARGWQNSAVSLQTGQRARLSSTGRCEVGMLPDTKLESTADGISLRWYRGRPVGTLLAAQWIDPPNDSASGRFDVLATGGMGTVTAVADGPLYFKINESPGDLADNAGSLQITLTPEAKAP
jgi:hypothetical protein